MLTDQVLEQMARDYPLDGDFFTTHDIGEWLWARYSGENWVHYCCDLIAHVVHRAAQLGFRPDRKARGVYRRIRTPRGTARMQTAKVS